MESVNVPELIASLGSNDDSVKKMAAFKLQTNISDPSFADTFISHGGLVKLRSVALQATGNTLAYGLASFSNLLELDQGWDTIDAELTDRLVQFVVGQPLVNILRGALSILTAIVSHPQEQASDSGVFGFRALRPALETYPTFLEMMVSRLWSADHALSANALQLINALMRDAITNERESEWRGFVAKLRDLGVISAAYALMQSSGLQDLAHPLLEFQSLTKLLMRKWKEIRIDWENKEHRRALKLVYHASKPARQASRSQEENPPKDSDQPEKWRQLGFDTETPTEEFQEVGYVGLLDLLEFVTKNEDGFQRLLLEQATKAPAQRCPIAKASLSVTAILYDHFEVDRMEDDQQKYVALESRQSFDKVFKPLLLQWTRLHKSGLQAFVRLWAATGAEAEDFVKIEELVRILVEHVVGLAPRTKDVSDIEQDLADYELSKLRNLQMELLELTHEDAWGHHLRHVFLGNLREWFADQFSSQVKEELHHEALQFIKEQRIRCLLAGAWFSNPADTATSPTMNETPTLSPNLNSSTWRFVRLSHNRRYLHYADFDSKTPPGSEPNLDILTSKIDLTTVSSVVSNVSPSSNASSAASSTTTLLSPDHGGKSAKPTRNGTNHKQHQTTNTKITIHGHLPSTSTSASAQTKTRGSSRVGGQPPKSPTHARNQSSLSSTAKVPSAHSKTQQNPSSPTTGTSTAAPSSPTSNKEVPLLTLHPATHTLASEFLDGLLMLLNQAPITAETNKLVQFIARYGLRIRLLNVRFEEEIGAGGVAGIGGGGADREVVLPDREGVDDDFFYDVGVGGS